MTFENISSRLFLYHAKNWKSGDIPQSLLIGVQRFHILNLDIFTDKRKKSILAFANKIKCLFLFYFTLSYVMYEMSRCYRINSLFINLMGRVTDCNKIEKYFPLFYMKIIIIRKIQQSSKTTCTPIIDRRLSVASKKYYIYYKLLAIFL